MQYASRAVPIILLTAVFFLPGCVERKLTVQTEPENARLYLDYRSRGTTPVTLPFSHYGSRAVRLEKNGYITKRTSLTLETPVHSYFPISLFTEVLYPFTIKDHRTFTFKLSPKTLPADLSVEERRKKREQKRSKTLRRARDLKKRAPDQTQQDPSNSK